jgi:hypothetical protein
MRKVILVVFTIASIGVLSLNVAVARGGFAGAGFHGGVGGFHGFGRTGYRSGARWRGAAYGIPGLGLGLATGYDGLSYGHGDRDRYGYGEYAEYGRWAYSRYYGGRLLFFSAASVDAIWLALAGAGQVCD